MRRVETGIDKDGKAIFVSDEEVKPLAAEINPPGVPMIWAADAIPQVPSDGARPAYGRYFPPEGGVRVMVATIPPDAEVAPVDSDLLGAVEAALPGVLQDAEWDATTPGMHRTRTVDVGVVIEGAVILELDDGARKELGPGDWYVQNGTRHAWRNPFDEPCRMAIFLLGAAEP